MASFAVWEDRKRYVLGPPLIPRRRTPRTRET